MQNIGHDDKMKCILAQENEKERLNKNQTSNFIIFTWYRSKKKKMCTSKMQSDVKFSNDILCINDKYSKYM